MTAAIPKDALVCDVMAGVGAFGMFLARKGCVVLANDLNPRALDCIKLNATRNKVIVSKPYQTTIVSCIVDFLIQVPHKIALFNEDGRDFIRKCLDDLKVLTKTNLSLEEVPLCMMGGDANRVAKRRRINVEATNAPSTTPEATEKGTSEENGSREQQRIVALNATELNETKLGGKRIRHVLPSVCLGHFEYTEVHFLMNLPQIAIEFLGELEEQAVTLLL